MLRSGIITVVLLLAAALALPPGIVAAGVDWEVSDAVQLAETPIDVARTPEGDMTFLLTDQAKVVIYGAEGELVGTVPVDPAVTDIAVSAKGEQLYLINGKRRTLQTVDISFIVDLNVAGAPFLGPAGAGVTVAVFSDFQ